MTETLLDLDPSLNHAPKEIKNVHILGICGTAMAAMAGMLKDTGYRVTGSDSHVYPPMSDLLEQLGIELFSGYSADNLLHHPDLAIVGNVITRKNPEAQALAESNIPYLSMPQALSHFFLDKRRSLVIAGTHGKTTTSSMLATALYLGGQDPSFMIGGVVNEFKANYRIGNGPFFVVEGDEYDTAFFDKESKFLHYQPEVAVITSIEFDHADIFADLDEIKRSVRKFVALLPEHGLLIANGDDSHVVDVISEAPCRVQSYGRHPDSDWRITSIETAPGKTSFDLLFNSDLFSRLCIKLPGTHNCMNSAAAAAAMHHLDIDRADIAAGLQNFGGVKRRQEIRGVVRNITIIDDFAHHPTAVRETLKGLKHAYTDNRVIAVFEPRTNTSRRSIFQQAYASSFDNADISIIRDPDQSKPVSPDDCFSAAQLASDLIKRGKNAMSFTDTDSIISYLLEETRGGDIVAVLSNGGFDNIHERLLAALDED